MFEEIKNEELKNINGGGVGGALLGFVVGNDIGVTVGIICSNVSRLYGDSDRVAGEVGAVAYTATVALFVFVGALLPV